MIIEITLYNENSAFARNSVFLSQKSPTKEENCGSRFKMNTLCIIRVAASRSSKISWRAVVPVSCAWN